MVKRKKLISLGMAVAITAALPVNSWAVSPEFARTPEEWERLRDNIMEYDELAGLIHEYNVTVQNNQIDYNKFLKDYGTKKEDFAKKYRDLANEIEDNIIYPHEDDASYAQAMMGIVGKEEEAKNLRKKADENVDDSMILWLDYQAAEDTLVTVAQTNMIIYHQKQLELQTKQSQRDLLAAQYDSMVVKKGVGMATQLDVLNAQESLLKAEKDINSLQTEVKNVKQKLCTMLGWSYNAEPEIQGIPNTNIGWIEQIDLEHDKALALENNYTLKRNKRKLENATEASNRDSLNNSIKDNETKIPSAVTSKYQELLSAQIAYDRAVAEAAVESQNMNVAGQKFQLGQISRLEYQEKEYLNQEKQMGQAIAEMDLVQAIENYNWAVKGLAEVK